MEHWAAFDNVSLLRDPEVSGLPLLNVSDGELMTNIFADNGSGWIKIGVVRDPVTRLLSAYLDLVRSRGARSRTSELMHGGGGERRWRQEEGAEARFDDDDNRGVALAFKEFLDTLETNVSRSPPAFRPMSSLCGMEWSPFDTIVPFETLQVRS